MTQIKGPSDPLRHTFPRQMQEGKLDEREFPYLILVLGAFGLFMGFMIVATLREKAWLRRTGQK